MQKSNLEELKMKILIYLKSITILLLLAFCTVPGFAQPGQGRGIRGQWSEEDVKARVESLSDTLNLSEKQEKEILMFELEFIKTMQKERENFDPETGDREVMRARMMEIRDDRDARYKEVLTTEQFAKYTEMVEERRSRMRQRPGERPGSESKRSRGRGRG
jgi:periplasmic protein CpxP/Spy